MGKPMWEMARDPGSDSTWRPESGPGYSPEVKSSRVSSPMGTSFMDTPSSAESFDLGAFAKARGFRTVTPGGTPFASGSWDAFSSFIRDQYGMDPQDFLSADATTRYNQWAAQNGVAANPEDIPLGPDGMPTRPPKTPQEAALFQWQGGETARKKNEGLLTEAKDTLKGAAETQKAAELATQLRNRELVKNAQDTLRYAFGVLRRGGEGSLAAFQSPMLQQLSDVYMGARETAPEFGAPYMAQLAQVLNSSQYTEPDYSFWLTPMAQDKEGGKY